jgi:hypothetical protein
MHTNTKTTSFIGSNPEIMDLHCSHDIHLLTTSLSLKSPTSLHRYSGITFQHTVMMGPALRSYERILQWSMQVRSTVSVHTSCHTNVTCSRKCSALSFLLSSVFPLPRCPCPWVIQSSCCVCFLPPSVSVLPPCLTFLSFHACVIVVDSWLVSCFCLSPTLHIITRLFL